ncbi:DUF4003 family protein [Neobacillus drentensis]|uniref:DUF4003 family protein n=1 Tax=Neobacillus drentensis TaxID=220684 RepID=UPI003001B9FC
MLEQTGMVKIDVYRDIYSQLYTGLKWKTDKRSLMLIAALYVTNGKEFNFKRFMDLADYIKSEVGFFSQLKSVTRYTTAATLDTLTDDPKSSFNHFIKLYEKLIENGFSRQIYTYIAAGTLLKVEQTRVDEITKKTCVIYKGMKEHHFFLTNAADYPLSAILALSTYEPAEIINKVEGYYNALKDEGFSIGNDLQFLSHILALDAKHQPNEKAIQCSHIQKLLKENNLKTKKAYYPYIGMLTYLDNVDAAIKNLYEINESLNEDKLFKWNKDINFMMSVLFLMSHLTTLGDAAKTTFNTTIEILIQAQQAAMTASITAATVASSSSGGD